MSQGLLRAVAAGDVAAAAEALARPGADVAIADQAALCIAAREGPPELFRLLLQAPGADPYACCAHATTVPAVEELLHVPGIDVCRVLQGVFSNSIHTYPDSDTQALADACARVVGSSPGLAELYLPPPLCFHFEAQPIASNITKLCLAIKAMDAAAVAACLSAYARPLTPEQVTDLLVWCLTLRRRPFTCPQRLLRVLPIPVNDSVGWMTALPAEQNEQLLPIVAMLLPSAAPREVYGIPKLLQYGLLYGSLDTVRALMAADCTQVRTFKTAMHLLRVAFDRALQHADAIWVREYVAFAKPVLASGDAMELWRTLWQVLETYAKDLHDDDEGEEDVSEAEEGVSEAEEDVSEAEEGVSEAKDDAFEDRMAGDDEEDTAEAEEDATTGPVLDPADLVKVLMEADFAAGLTSSDVTWNLTQAVQRRALGAYLLMLQHPEAHPSNALMAVAIHAGVDYIRPLLEHPEVLAGTCLLGHQWWHYPVVMEEHPDVRDLMFSSAVMTDPAGMLEVVLQQDWMGPQLVGTILRSGRVTPADVLPLLKVAPRKPGYLDALIAFCFPE